MSFFTGTREGVWYLQITHSTPLQHLGSYLVQTTLRKWRYKNNQGCSGRLFIILVAYSSMTRECNVPELHQQEVNVLFIRAAKWSIVRHSNFSFWHQTHCYYYSSIHYIYTLAQASRVKRYKQCISFIVKLPKMDLCYGRCGNSVAVKRGD